MMKRNGGEEMQQKLCGPRIEREKKYQHMLTHRGVPRAQARAAPEHNSTPDSEHYHRRIYIRDRKSLCIGVRRHILAHIPHGTGRNEPNSQS